MEYIAKWRDSRCHQAASLSNKLNAYSRLLYFWYFALEDVEPRSDSTVPLGQIEYRTFVAVPAYNGRG